MCRRRVVTDGASAVRRRERGGVPTSAGTQMSLRALRDRWTSCSLGLSFGGQPMHDADGDGMPTESGEATETPEIDSPLDET